MADQTINPETSLVMVSATEVGPAAMISELTNYDWTRTREGTRRRYVFGDAAARVKPGNKTSSYRLGGLYAPTDTDGQNVLETAFEAGTDLWLTVLPDGEVGWMEKGKVTEYSGTAEREGDYIEVTFTFEGDGVKTAVDTTAP